MLPIPTKQSYSLVESPTKHFPTNSGTSSITLRNSLNSSKIYLTTNSQSVPITNSSSLWVWVKSRRNSRFRSKRRNYRNRIPSKNGSKTSNGSYNRKSSKLHSSNNSSCFCWRTFSWSQTLVNCKSCMKKEASQNSSSKRMNSKNQNSHLLLLYQAD